MEFSVKFLFFFVLTLNAAIGQTELDSVEDPEQFHIDKHQETRDVMNSNMDRYFLNLWEMLTDKLDRNQEALSANLSREFSENMGNLSRNLSESFDEKLLRSESNIKREIESHDESMRTNHQNLSSSIWNLTTVLIPPPWPTEVEEVNAESGTIEFTGGANSNLRTKIWVLRSEGGDVFRYVSFVLQKNGLGDAGRLSLWGSGYSNGNQLMWNGSQSDWGTPKTSFGHVILVTLLISPEASEIPSFKLEFNTTNTFTYKTWSRIVLGKGPQVVSFPANNADNYTPWSEFVALVASPSGEPNELSLKYLDIPGTPPDACGEKEFSVWLLQESPTGLPYTKLPSSICRPCGRVGPTSDFLGAATFAILRFKNDDKTSVGRGFSVNIN